MFTLMPFQVEDAKWLAQHPRLLANDCGTGKTHIAVEAAKQHAKGPVLVIAPRYTKAWWAWAIEAQQAGYVGVCGQAGRGIPWAKVATWRHPQLLWVVIHHDAVRYVLPQLRSVKWDWIIADEAHAFKSRRAQRTRALWKIPSRMRSCLTATPYGNNPADLWAMLHWLYPSHYTSYWAFRGKYVEEYQPPGRKFTIVQGPKNLEGLARELAPYYRKRHKKDVLNLLPPVYRDIPVEIEGAQAELYIRLLKDSYAVLAGHEVVLENALVRILRLQQCALDPALLADTGLVAPLGVVPAKVAWLHEWLELHPEEPVVIVSRFRKFVESWLVGLVDKACIVGGMSIKRTKEALSEFQRTGRLVGTLDALKEGLNLQRAATMIVTDGTFSAIAEYQLRERIHRVGQARQVQVMHLVGLLPGKRVVKTVDYLLRKAVNRKMSEAELVDEFVKEAQNVCNRTA